MRGDVGLASVCTLVKSKFTIEVLLSPPPPLPLPDSQPDPDEVAIDVVAMSLFLEQGKDHSCLIVCQQK